MPLSKSAATDLVAKYLPEWESNRNEVDTIDRWYRGKLVEADKPRLSNPSREYRQLRDRSMTHWLGLVVTATAQSLYVEGYRNSDTPDNAVAWDAWQKNGLDSRQTSVHRGALAHGLSYVTVLPGVLNGEAMPRIRGVSARKGVAFYADMDDDWPLYFVDVETIHREGEKVKRVRLWDAEAIYTFDKNPRETKPQFLTSFEHPLGVCPVVQFSNLRDLDGRTMGEVEPYIEMAARIDQDTMDRLTVQRMGAHLAKWIAGLELPSNAEDPDKVDQEAAQALKMRLAVEDILVAEDKETRFGAFPATPLNGYIDARDADIRDLAAVTQTPPHHLLGHVANLSAEALAAAEAGLTRKVEERKHSFGESWEQVLRAAGVLLGQPEDFAAQVKWRDMESRSLAQAADALGKIATMLGVPPQALWEKIPGVTQTDVESWKQLAQESDAFGSLVAQLTGDMAPADDPAGT